MMAKKLGISLTKMASKDRGRKTPNTISGQLLLGH
jgi:hypothetical protein